MRIAIAGYGIEGEASCRYYMARGDEVTVLDEREQLDRPLPEGAAAILGPHAFEDLTRYDQVVRTPALRPDKLRDAKSIWSATNEFFAKCPAPIIGVTGTKGKGTTSSLITHILRHAGYTVHLLGNIGTPALEVLPTIKKEDIVVFEISSFQLWDLTKSPHVAVVLMIEPDHLDVHTDLEEYIEAKANIRRYQSAADVCVVHPTNSYSNRVARVTEKGRTIRYGTRDEDGVYVEDGQFMTSGRVICSLDALQLVGQHNIENACAAITAARVHTTDDMAIAEGLRSFTGLPHRLQMVREYKDIMFFNDSYSSAPGATIAAIRSFDRPIILLAGGYDKHASFEELTSTIEHTPNIKSVYLMGQTRQKLAQVFEAAGFNNYVVCDEQTLKPIFERAVSVAEPGDIVLLSPGCASFDMFANFTDRGQQFCKLVEEL